MITIFHNTEDDTGSDRPSAVIVRITGAVTQMLAAAGNFLQGGRHHILFGWLFLACGIFWFAAALRKPKASGSTKSAV